MINTTLHTSTFSMPFRQYAKNELVEVLRRKESPHDLSEIVNKIEQLIEAIIIEKVSK